MPSDSAVWFVPDGVVDGRGPIPKAEQEAAAETGGWFACRHPERRFDRNTCLHDCCRACLVAVTAAIANGYPLGADEGGSVVDVMAARLVQFGEVDA